MITLTEEEDREILINALAKVLKQTGRSRESFEQNVKENFALTDPLYEMSMEAINRAFSN